MTPGPCFSCGAMRRRNCASGWPVLLREGGGAPRIGADFVYYVVVVSRAIFWHRQGTVGSGIQHAPASAWGLITLTLMSSFALQAQSTAPSVVIDSLPAWGQIGPVTGHVLGLQPNTASILLFAFVPDLGWAVLPNCSGLNPDSNGQFSISTGLATVVPHSTRFSAYLVPYSIAALPCTEGSPSIPLVVTQNAFASVTYPRLPQYQTLSFGGLQWFIKSAPAQVWPNNNYWPGGNSFVDASGNLHLQVSSCPYGNGWCSAEIFTTQTLGYGTYSFNISSSLNDLDPNLTLGLFTWDAQASQQSNREWDLEFSRWGGGPSPDAQYVVQPYSSPTNIQHFTIGAAGATTHFVNWLTNSLSFSSYTGNTLIDSWTYTPNTFPVPTPGDVHLHMNFYVGTGASPQYLSGQEIIVSNFQYLPSQTSIGLTRTVDALTGEGGSRSISLNGSQGCYATAESDSPWIALLTSGAIPSSGTIQYIVAKNSAGSRSGNIILTSTSCNVTLGSQSIAITQAPLLTTSTSVSVSANPLAYGQSVTLFASVNPSAATGTVTFLDGNATLGQATVSAGLASLTLGSLNVGAHSVSAVYSGDSAYAPSTSSVVAVTISAFGISTTQLPAGNIGAPYSQTLIAFGGNPPYGNWALCVGCALPLGLALNSVTGVISGIPAGPGTSFTVTVQDSAGHTSGPASLSIAVQLPATSINSGGIVSNASYQSGAPVSPGSLVSVFGQFPVATESAQILPLPTTISGLTISFQNQGDPTSSSIDARLLFVSPTLANVQVPWGVAKNVSAWTATVSANAPSSTIGAPVNVLLAQVSPGVFTVDSNGSGQAVAIDALSGQLISASNPAIAGTTYISIYCTGLGPVTNQPPTGAAASASPLSSTTTAPTVMIGNVRGNVLFSGLAPGFVGLYQINVQVPSGVSPGSNVPLVVSIAGATAPTVTIAVQTGP